MWGGTPGSPPLNFVLQKEGCIFEEKFRDNVVVQKKEYERSIVGRTEYGGGRLN